MKFSSSMLILLFTKAAQWAVHITMGCTAGSLTACRLRTSCYDKLYFLYRIRFLKSFPLRRLCIIF